MKILKLILFILVFCPISLMIGLGLTYWKLHHRTKMPVVLIQCWDKDEPRHTNSRPSYSQAWARKGSIGTFVDAGISWKEGGKDYFIKGDCQARNATTEDESILSPDNYLGAQSLDDLTR